MAHKNGVRDTQAVRMRSTSYCARFLPVHVPFRLLVLILVIGAALRLLGPIVGYHFVGHHHADLETFRSFADVADRGENIYAEQRPTHQAFNYGGVWFVVIGLLSRCSSLLSTDPTWGLWFALVSLLTAVDVGIAYLLLTRYGPLAAMLFFLSPVSIITTGYHAQFDAAALLIGMVAVVLLGTGAGPPITSRALAGLVVLGVSLATKHLLIFFPVWLAFRQKGLGFKLVTLAVPYGIFFGSFVPYGEAGRQGIVQVLLYRSFDNAPFWRTFAPQLLTAALPPAVWFVLTMIVCGLLFRKRELWDLFLIYTCVLVIFSSAIANQYLAIPIAYIASQPNVLLGLYTLAVTFYLTAKQIQHLVVVYLGGREVFDKRAVGYEVHIALLCCGFIYALNPGLLGECSRRTIRWVKTEWKVQWHRE